MIERLIDIAADEMGVDPAELRRRNTIPPSAMPYKTPLTFTYDSGRFEENMDRVMKLADWEGFEKRRQAAAKRGVLRGIGISNTIEQAADPTIETAEIRFDPLGGMTFVTGSISHGPRRRRRRSTVKCSERKPSAEARYSPVALVTGWPSRAYHSRRGSTEAGEKTEIRRRPGSGATRRISRRTPSLSGIVPQVLVVQIARSKRGGSGAPVASARRKCTGPAMRRSRATAR